MRTRTLSLVAVAATALALSACSTQTETAGNEAPADAETMTVTSYVHAFADPEDYASEVSQSTVEVEVPVNPQRVVVLDGTQLEVISGIGVPASQIAGLAPWGVDVIAPEYTAESVADVTSADGEYDVEKIEALDPDLIITGYRGAAALLPGIEDIDAPQIELTPYMGHTVETFAESAATLGKIFQKEDEAQKLVEAFDTALTDVQAATADSTGIVVMTTGGAISGTPEGDARYGKLYSEFGITAPESLAAVIKDIEENSTGGGEHGWELSSEAILAGNPDWIYVIDRDASFSDPEQPAAQILDNELINQTTAGSKGQIVYLNPVEMYAGEGMVSYTHAAQQITEQIGAAR